MITCIAVHSLVCKRVMRESETLKEHDREGVRERETEREGGEWMLLHCNNNKLNIARQQPVIQNTQCVLTYSN